MDWQAVELTALLAGCTTLILFVAGLPLANWLVHSKARWKFIVESIVSLPLVLPPTVLGFYILVMLGPRSPVGAAFESVFGTRLAFSFGGILIASVLHSLPFAIRPFTAAIGSVDRRLVDVARCLGSSPFSAFRRVVMPLAWPGILAGLVLTFMHTVGEFGVVLMVGGNIPGVTRTISIAIYDDVQALDYEKANLTAAVLLGVSFLSLCLTYALQRKHWRM